MTSSNDVVCVYAQSERDLLWIQELVAPLQSEYSHWHFYSNWNELLDAVQQAQPTCCLVHTSPDVELQEVLGDLTPYFSPHVLPLVYISNTDDADVEQQEHCQFEVLSKANTNSLKLFGSIASAVRIYQLQGREAPNVKTDPLTGLINRELLLNRLEQSLNRCNRYRERCALLCINVNQFKSINEKYGHATGDQLLKDVAERIAVNCRSTDSVARLNGDEFVVLIENADKNIGRKVADKLNNELTQRYNINDQSIAVTIAMGMATYPDTALNAPDLLKQAGQALTKARGDKEVNFVCFSEQHKTQLYRRHVLELELARAIDNDDLKLVYQPIVDASTFKIERLEALSRWPREDFNVPAPELIEMVDRLNLTDAFHKWLFQTAFKQLKQWQQESVCPDLCLNIPANFCYSKTISTGVIEELKNFDIAPEKVELEITESTLMRYPERSIKVLNNLHDVGIKIAVDDFGTGFSCMSYLTSLPIDTLKIDRDFFLAQNHKLRNKKVIEAITALGHSLELQIIAEGVETQVQLELAQTVGCDLLQGYYFGKPESPGNSWVDYAAHFEHISPNYPK